MIKVDEKKIKEAENAIRDLINWIKVWNLEEIEGGVKKIEDDVVTELLSRLEKIAKKVSGMSVIV